MAMASGIACVNINNTLIDFAVSKLNNKIQ